MNNYLLAAGVLSFLLGLAHSVFGEILIFKKKRRPGSVVPSMRSEGLAERHLRIIWATWHLASIFGWCLGALLIFLSHAVYEPARYLIPPVIVTMLSTSLLVLVATKGKHPGWLVLLIIGVLLILGM